MNLLKTISTFFKSGNDSEATDSNTEDSISWEEYLKQSNRDKPTAFQRRIADERTRSYDRKIRFVTSIKFDSVAVEVDVKEKMIRLDGKVFESSEITGLEVVEDGGSIIKSVGTNLMARTVAGGILFGSVGAIVGATSADKKLSSTIDRIDLRVYLNSSNEPLKVVNFLKFSTPSGSDEHTKALGDAKRVQSIIEKWLIPEKFVSNT